MNVQLNKGVELQDVYITQEETASVCQVLELHLLKIIQELAIFDHMNKYVRQKQVKKQIRCAEFALQGN